MTREETRDKLISLIEPLLEGMDYELLRLDYVVGKHGYLNIFIDSENGINVNDCETVSRAVSELLDLHDPIAHAYTLEVSSPGIERPLSKKSHFIKYLGEKVRVKTREQIGDSKKISGLLQKAGEDTIEVQKLDGTTVSIPYILIDRANLWYTGPEKNSMAKSSGERG